MAYRIIITDTTPTDTGMIRFGCLIESDKTGTWQALPAAPLYIDIRAEQLLAVIRQPLNAAEKRAELLATFKSHTRALPLLIAAIAIDQIDTLLPVGWPITVNL